MRIHSTASRDSAPLDTLWYAKMCIRDSIQSDHVVRVTDADVAAERRTQRGEAAQLYEQNEVQRALAVFYKDLARHMPNDRIVIVDAFGTVDEVHARVWAAYEKAFAD